MAPADTRPLLNGPISLHLRPLNRSGLTCCDDAIVVESRISRAPAATRGRGTIDRVSVRIVGDDSSRSTQMNTSRKVATVLSLALVSAFGTLVVLVHGQSAQKESL